MSLIRQIWLLLVVTMLLAFLGSLGLWVWSSRGYLETQLRLKNADNAQALALSLSQQGGDLTLVDLTIAAQFDTGFYSRIQLRDPAGRLLSSHQAPDARDLGQVPAWFVSLAPIASPVGLAQVTDGWRPLGAVEVVSQAGFAHQQLWQGTARTALWLAALSLLSTGLAVVGVRAIRRPLLQTIRQAQALSDRRFITVPVPSTPELAQVTLAMNAVVLRLRSVFDEQASQLELLRRQAHCDPVTGLAKRAHFLQQVQSMLTLEDGAPSGLFHMVRVMDLGAVNRRLGHRQTDEFLGQLARSLQEMVQGMSGAVVGRLNGGDFAMCLASSDITPPQAADVADALRRLVTEQAVPASVVVGSTNWGNRMPMSEVLAAADAALARAEIRGDFAVEHSTGSATVRAPVGQEAWRNILQEALDEGRLQLHEHPVLDRRGQLIHLECPMRIRLHASGGLEPAAQWLPMATRCGFLPRIDAMAIDLALRASERDGLARSVNVSLAALRDGAWVTRLHERLLQSPAASQRLWLEVPEWAAQEVPDLLRELSARTRPLGARVGLEHAGERIARLKSLVELGLDFIKLDGAVVRRLGEEASERSAYITATTRLLHGLGLQVFAEGIDEPADIQALWTCGLDGVTGPAVQRPAA